MRELETQQMMDYLLNFSFWKVPCLLFTVLVCCLLAALELTGNTKDHRALLLDYEVKGYSTVVLFRKKSIAARPQQMAVRCQTNQWLAFN